MLIPCLRALGAIKGSNSTYASYLVIDIPEKAIVKLCG
jgi:hypothetical protein